MVALFILINFLGIYVISRTLWARQLEIRDQQENLALACSYHSWTYIPADEGHSSEKLLICKKCLMLVSGEHADDNPGLRQLLKPNP